MIYHNYTFKSYIIVDHKHYNDYSHDLHETNY